MVQVSVYSESELNRVREFVDFLLSNTCIKNEPLIISERHILNFIEKYPDRISEIISEPELLPDLKWDDFVFLIQDNIYNRISISVLPYLNKFLDNSDLSFFDRLSQSGVVSDIHRRTKLHDFVIMLLKNRDVRFRMNPVIEIFRNDAVDRYITAAFSKREYIYNELTRVEKIHPDANEYIKLIKVALLIRGIVHLKLNIDHSAGSANMTLADAADAGLNITANTDAAASAVSSMLPGIPPEIIKIAIRSNVSSDRPDSDEILSKLIFILCSMFENCRHADNPGRKAEPAEKSWLAIAKKNCVYYKYDSGIIDSLYLIAGENNW